MARSSRAVAILEQPLQVTQHVLDLICVCRVQQVEKATEQFAKSSSTYLFRHNEASMRLTHLGPLAGKKPESANIESHEASALRGRIHQLLFIGLAKHASFGSALT